MALVWVRGDLIRLSGNDGQSDYEVLHLTTCCCCRALVGAAKTRSTPTTNFARQAKINIPLASAAMDTVTNLGWPSPSAGKGYRTGAPQHADRPAGEEVDRVKRSESGMIVDPVTNISGITLRQALEL